jgi:hypothetical protein
MRLFGRERDIPQELRSIYERLQSLKKKDRRHAIFGSPKHLYRNHPVSEIDLMVFESRCAVSLPKTYRDFLRYIGPGGGPYYGLWSLKQIREELEMLQKDSEPSWDIRKTVGAPFPLTQTDVERIQAMIQAGEKHPFLNLEWPVTGCLPICHQGCSYWSLLVTTGEFAGCVWDVDAYDSNGSWLPGRRAPGIVNGKIQPTSLADLAQPPTFIQWFEGWLERSFVDLENKQMKT